MSKKLPGLTATVLAALLVAPVIAASSSAAAADRRDLRPTVTLVDDDGSEVSLLACLEPARQGRAWRVFLRLDNTQGTGPAAGSLAVKRDGRQVARGATGRVRAGEVSPILSFRAPRKKDLVLRSALRTAHSGGVGIGPLDLRRC